MKLCSVDDNIIVQIEKGKEDDERMNKRRKCRNDQNGLCRMSSSDHQCHCRCGCIAFWKEQVRCVHCQNYIIDNRIACQCCFYVHSLTDDAICHMCHNEKYASFSGFEKPNPHEEDRQISKQADAKSNPADLQVSRSQAYWRNFKDSQSSYANVDVDVSVESVKKSKPDISLMKLRSRLEKHDTTETKVSKKKTMVQTRLSFVQRYDCMQSEPKDFRQS